MPSAGIGYSNKILWVVGVQRTGDLAIDGVPLGKTGPVVHYSFPANSSPGEIYPSGVDVPEAGCWAFTLRFAGQTAQIELAYRLAASRAPKPTELKLALDFLAKGDEKKSREQFALAVFNLNSFLYVN